MSTKPILVAGITGQIGSELAKLLVAAGADVVGLTRDPSKAPAELGKMRLVQGDLAEPRSLAPAFGGVEKAFFMCEASPHLAQLGSNFFEAAKSAGVRHVVIVSSSTILFEPLPAIGKWHLELERCLEASGLAWTMLRPGNFASNTLRWAPTIRAQGTVFQAYGDIQSAPIDPRDIAAVAFAVLTSPNHEGQRYVLTGPELLSPRQQVEQLGQAIGKTIRFVEVPEEGARKGMLSAGMSEVMAEAILELIRPTTSGRDTKTTTIRDVTGHEARAFDVWVRDNVAAFA